MKKGQKLRAKVQSLVQSLLAFLWTLALIPLALIPLALNPLIPSRLASHRLPFSFAKKKGHQDFF